MPRTRDITNQRFGRLVAIRPEGLDANRNVRWLCQCDCGNSHITTTTRLLKGDTHTCGCRNAFYRHGHAARVGGKRHPLYAIWVDMRGRCNNPNHHAYQNYGGRGIKVSKRWNDFTVFVADVGPRPPGLWLDRINNDGNYTPRNIRWATPKTQMNNRRPRKRKTL